jgi:hypothetical protein
MERASQAVHLLLLHYLRSLGEQIFLLSPGRAVAVAWRRLCGPRRGYLASVNRVIVDETCVDRVTFSFFLMQSHRAFFF